MLEEYMEYNGKRIRPHCLKCKYLDNTKVDHFRCHGGSCPDFTLTDEEREHVINHFEITVSLEVPTPEEDTTCSMVEGIARELDKEIIGKIMNEIRKEN